MGFGLLFIGCFIAYVGSLSGMISGYTYALGAAIILFALRKLIYEGKMFIASAVCAVILEISALLCIGIQIFSGEVTQNTVAIYIMEASAYTFSVLLMLGICFLSKAVGLKHLFIMAIVNVSSTAFCGFLYMLTEVIKNEAILPWISLFYLAFKLLLTVFSLVILFGAYMRICYEGDEKMQVENSGFAPFDKLNDLSNKAFSSKPKTGKGGKK